MIHKIVTTAVQCFIICLAAEVIRQVWNPDKDDKEAEKKEENK